MYVCEYMYIYINRERESTRWICRYTSLFSCTCSFRIVSFCCMCVCVRVAHCSWPLQGLGAEGFLHLSEDASKAGLRGLGFRV